MKEKRKHERVKRYFAVNIAGVDTEGKTLMPDENGLNTIKTNGIIKWLKEARGKYKKYFTMGICFEDLESEDKEKLINLWKKYR